MFSSQSHRASSSYEMHQWMAELVPNASKYRINTIEPNSVHREYVKREHFKSRLHARIVTGRLVELSTVIQELVGRNEANPAISKLAKWLDHSSLTLDIYSSNDTCHRDFHIRNTAQVIEKLYPYVFSKEGNNALGHFANENLAQGSADAGGSTLSALLE